MKISMTQAELDRRAVNAGRAYLLLGNRPDDAIKEWGESDDADKDWWRKIALAVLEGNGDTVEIIPEETEVPDEVSDNLLSVWAQLVSDDVAG